MTLGATRVTIGYYDMKYIFIFIMGFIVGSLVLYLVPIKSAAERLKNDEMTDLLDDQNDFLIFYHYSNMDNGYSKYIENRKTKHLSTLVRIAKHFVKYRTSNDQIEFIRIVKASKEMFDLQSARDFRERDDLVSLFTSFDENEHEIIDEHSVSSLEKLLDKYWHEK